MVKCPKCGNPGKQIKQWVYGPKTRKGGTFDVILYECRAGHRWRVYKKKASR